VSTFTLPSVDDPMPTVGTYCFVAVYTAAQGGNYVSVPRQSDPECFQVTPADSSTTTQQSTSSSGPGSINLGGTITDTATVSADGNTVGGAPTGTVTFTVCGPLSADGVCSDGTAVGTAPAPLTTGSGSSTATSAGFTPTAVGIYCFAAVYNPDSSSNYLSSPDNVSGDVQANECFRVTQPNFTIQKTDVPGNGNPVAPGSTIPYTVTITNTGDGTGTGLVSDTIPSNLTVQGTPSCAVSGPSPEACTPNPPSSGSTTWTFNVTDLAPGDVATATFSAVVAATDTADVVNTATLTGVNPCQSQTTAIRSHAATDPCSSTVTNPVPDFTVTKSDGPGANTPVAAGSTIPYTVAVKNVGDGAGSAVISDPLPSQLTAQGTPSCSAPSGTCTAAVSGSTVTVHVNNLAAGDTATATFSAVVSATATGTITNTATITTGPCNTSSGCSSSVANPIIVTAAAAPPPPAPVIAFTGADIAAMVAAALALLGLGGFLVIVSRRRRREEQVG
jgi:fimbrial isopeptide formation D2 family protein